MSEQDYVLATSLGEGELAALRAVERVAEDRRWILISTDIYLGSIVVHDERSPMNRSRMVKVCARVGSFLQYSVEALFRGAKVEFVVEISQLGYVRSDDEWQAAGRWHTVGSDVEVTVPRPEEVRVLD